MLSTPITIIVAVHAPTAASLMDRFSLCSRYTISNNTLHDDHGSLIAARSKYQEVADLRCPEFRSTKVSKFPICAALSPYLQRLASFRAALRSDPQMSASFRAALR